MCDLPAKFFELILLPIVIGVATGLISSHLVSRRYLKKALLDECVRLVKRLCPYRKENVRDGDGLDETSWALQIQSEMLARRRFAYAAAQVAAIAKDVGTIPPLRDHGDAAARKERDSVKERWHRALGDLY